MEIHDFKVRLRMLAADVEPAGAAPQQGLSNQQIMGRLWSAELSRKAQCLAIWVFGFLMLVWYKPVFADASPLVSSVILVAFAVVTGMLSAIVPYWAFRRGVHEALLALADLRLNDPARFIAAQRTDLTVLSPRLMKDLCKGLYNDARLSN